MTLPVTPSQTIGPFFSVGLIWADGPDVVDPPEPVEVEAVRDRPPAPDGPVPAEAPEVPAGEPKEA